MAYQRDRPSMLCSGIWILEPPLLVRLLFVRVRVRSVWLRYKGKGVAPQIYLNFVAR